MWSGNKSTNPRERCHRESNQRWPGLAPSSISIATSKSPPTPRRYAPGVRLKAAHPYAFGARHTIRKRGQDGSSKTILRTCLFKTNEATELLLDLRRSPRRRLSDRIEHVQMTHSISRTQQCCEPARLCSRTVPFRIQDQPRQSGCTGSLASRSASRSTSSRSSNASAAATVSAGGASNQESPLRQEREVQASSVTTRGDGSPAHHGQVFAESPQMSTDGWHVLDEFGLRARSLDGRSLRNSLNLQRGQILSTGSRVATRASPLSITVVTPSIVTELSATFVDKMIFGRSAGSTARSCSSGERSPYKGSSKEARPRAIGSQARIARRISAEPGRKTKRVAIVRMF